MELNEHHEQSSSPSPRVSTSAEGGSRTLSEKAKSDMAQAAESCKCEARRIAGDQKEAGAATIGQAAGAVHGAARSFESEMPQVANYIHDAATRLEDVASHLRNRNVDELVHDLGHLARSQPALVFGGAMLAGFALTRFLKSTAPGNLSPDASSSSPSSGGSTTTHPSSSGSSSSSSRSSHGGSDYDYDVGSVL